jgi:hypothetical protein
MRIWAGNNQNILWQTRAILGKRFRFTQITFALMTAILAIFAGLANLSPAGRWPIFGLLFVTAVRIIFIRRRIDVWMSAALVVATAAAALYLAEISGAPLGPTLSMVTAVCTGVLIGLAFAQSDTFLDEAKIVHKLHLTLDLGSMLRIAGRLLPVLLVFAILMPDLLRYARATAGLENVMDIFNNDDETETDKTSQTMQTSGIGGNIDASRASSLQLDWSPALAVSWKKTQPSNARHNGIQYWRSHSLSQGFGLTWELASVDLIPSKDSAAKSNSSDILASVLLARQDELFLLHPMGMRAVASAGRTFTLMPLANGGSMLNFATDSRAIRQVLYDLVTMDGESQPEPRPIHLTIPDDWQSSASSLRHRIFGITFPDDPQADSWKLGRIEAQLRQFFHDQSLSYSLNPGPLMQSSEQNQLESFLFDSKKGFCEHFASATASLLRIAGVPSRVVVGLAAKVDENEPKSILRRSDAHAWVEAWDRDLHAWQIIDPTTWITSFENLPSQQDTSFEWDHLFERALASFDAFGLEFALSVRSYTNIDNPETLSPLLRILLQQLENVAANLFFVKIALLAMAMGLFSILAYFTKMASRRLPTQRIMHLIEWQALVNRFKQLVQKTAHLDVESEDYRWSRERLQVVQQISATQRNVSQSVAEYLVEICASKAIPDTTVQQITQAFNGMLYSSHQDRETAQRHRAVIEEFIVSLKHVPN